MAPRGEDRAVYNEEERRKFLLGFHNRKQERKIEHLTKKALRAKQERVLEKLARKRNLRKRERELGLLDSEFDSSKKVCTQNSMEDSFSKNMFGTEEVTVTVEYDGGDDEDLLNQNDDGMDHTQENPEVEVEEDGDEENDDLNEEEEKILENVKLTENELRKIREEAGKKKHKKGKKKHRKGRR